LNLKREKETLLIKSFLVAWAHCWLISIWPSLYFLYEFVIDSSFNARMPFLFHIEQCHIIPSVASLIGSKREFYDFTKIFFGYLGNRLYSYDWWG
jgi:hypothetical protein